MTEKNPAASGLDAGSNFHVEANGIRFHCRIDGRKDAPWLVFSNSLATNLSLWDGQIATFENSFRILRYDQRGHGGTEVPSEPCSFEQLVDDVVALLDALAIPRATFVGVSMGAVTALRLAARHAEAAQEQKMGMRQEPCPSIAQPRPVGWSLEPPPPLAAVCWLAILHAAGNLAAAIRQLLSRRSARPNAHSYSHRL